MSKKDVGIAGTTGAAFGIVAAGALLGMPRHKALESQASRVTIAEYDWFTGERREFNMVFVGRLHLLDGGIGHIYAFQHEGENEVYLHIFRYNDSWVWEVFRSCWGKTDVLFDEVLKATFPKVEAPGVIAGGFITWSEPIK